MTTKDVLNQELVHHSSKNQGLLIGLVKSFDPITQRVEVSVDRAGGNRRYTGLPWPSLGAGIRSGAPRLNQPIVLGFVEGNSAVPVIITPLSGTGLGTEVHSDLSVMSRLGRLMLRQNLQ